MAGAGLIMWRVTYGSPCQIDGDKVQRETPFTVVRADGGVERKLTPSTSWHYTEGEARKAVVDWLQAKWERALAEEREAHRELCKALED